MEGVKKIIIIGGGISGLTTALALYKKGFEVEIYEKSPELNRINTGISIWPNASPVLKELGILDAVLAQGAVIKNLCLKTESGKILQQTSIEKSGVPGICIPGTEFTDLLISKLPDGIINTDKEFLKYQNDNNSVNAEFTDGTTVLCDLIIGADGLLSRTREQLKNDGKPVYRGYKVWSGTVEFSHKDLAVDTATEILGEGKRFGIIPLGKGRIGWWATANESLKEHQHMHGRKKKLKSKFKKWHAPIPQIIDATPDEDIIKINTYDREPSAGWHDGKVILLGDAAHPMTPDRGQSVCLAMEDAWILAELLEKEDHLEEALVKFEKLRYPRTTMITKSSLLHGKVGQWANPIAVKFRNTFINMMPLSQEKVLANEMSGFEVN